MADRVSRDQAVAFGPRRSLIGIVTSPREPADLPVVVMVNSGIIHRVGANRMYVSLARALADRGFVSLRFDLSGIGDSAPRKESLPLAEVVARDIDEALAFLRTTRNARRFIMVGLCSGAQDAFRTAVRNPAVGGLVLLDIPGPFRTWQHWLHHFARRIGRLESWRNTLLGRNSLLQRGRRLVRRDDEKPQMAESPGIRHASARAAMETSFLHILDRGVPVLVVFTSGMEDNYNHRSQFRETLPAAAGHPLVTYQYYPDADHVFSDLGHRTSVVSLIANWLTTTF